MIFQCGIFRSSLVKSNCWQLLSLALGVGLWGAILDSAPVAAQSFSADQSIGQVTSVSQLSDVRPTDWAFQALQSLVERYGCIAGYPDRTYRGNRAMSRYEFAAGLNACMDRVNELIAAATNDMTSKEDLATLQKLQEEFATELATLRGRVDAVEAKTAVLEKQQFSTTTKLNGEVIFGLAGAVAGQTFDDTTFLPGRNLSKNTVFGYRARLDLDTSFTGTDVLRTRLQAGNSDFSNAALAPLPEGSLRFASDSGSNLDVDALLYQFKLGEKTTVTIEANAGAVDDFVNTLNPLDGDGGSGALTQFGTRNPILYLTGGTGFGIEQELGDQLTLSLGYLAADAANPADKAGLFDGAYGAIAQLTFKPSEQLTIGATYLNSYKTTFANAGSPVGSFSANLISSTTGQEIGNAFSSNSYGLGVVFQLTPKIAVNGNVGYTTTRVAALGDLDIWNWSAGLAVQDLGSPGSTAGLIVGMEPRASRVAGNLQAVGIVEDRDTSLHIEGFYEYKLNDRISITPGIIWLTAPGHNQNNNDVVIGTIRTTFTF
ncbi:MAG: iron uptake porin [Alkalinema sp. RL_2_19]|nr:iron uptake porin [Alkalinema sp. RL_2_19]